MLQTVLGWLFGEGAEVVRDLGLSYMLRDTLIKVITGSAVSFSRFAVIVGALLCVIVPILHLWRGDSALGRFRLGRWTLAGIVSVGAFLVVTGTVDMTVTRVLEARREAHRELQEAPLTPAARERAVKAQVLRKVAPPSFLNNEIGY